MIYCPGCKTDLPTKSFLGPRSKKPYPYCRACRTRQYEALKLTGTYARTRAKTSDRNQRYIFQYLLEHPCVDCGETDILVLQFDHVTGSKTNDVSQMKWNCALEALQDEIAKTVVRCANCHQRVTEQRKPGYKTRLLAELRNTAKKS